MPRLARTEAPTRAHGGPDSRARRPRLARTETPTPAHGDPDSRGQPRMRLASPPHSFSRSSNFCTLPVDVFGSSVTISTALGAL